MFRSHRIQLLELGALSVKALIATISRGGRLSIEALRAEPLAVAGAGAEAYAAALAPVVAELGSGFLRRNLPVHLVPGASLVRGTVHHLPPVTEEAVPEILRTSRLHFVGSFGTRGPIHDRSFPLLVAREEEQVRVTAVHAYGKRADILMLKQAVEAAGLKPGAILPPALALSELAAALGRAQLDPKPRVLVDVGASSTAVLLFDENGVQGYRRVFGGAEDGFRRLPEDLPESPPEVLGQLRAAYVARGREGLDAQAQEAGLGADAAAVIAERVAAARDRLLSAVYHAVTALARPSSSAEDEDDDGAQAAEPAFPGPVALTGGGAQLEGFADALQARFEVPCSVLDAAAVLGMSAPSKAPDVAPAYACGLGAAAVLARMGDQADLADDPHALAALSQEEEGFPIQWAVRPLIAGAVLAVVVTVGFLGWGKVLEGRLADLQRGLDDEKASLPPADELRRVLLGFRDQRAREVGIDARFAYAGELLKERVRWGKLLAGIDRTLASGQCVLTGIDVRTSWPNAADGGQRARNRQKSVLLVLRGDAYAMPAVTQAAQALKAARLMKDPRARTTRSPGAGDPKAPGFQFEISGDIDGSFHDR